MGGVHLTPLDVRGLKFCFKLLLNSDNFAFEVLLHNNIIVFCSFPVVKEHRSAPNEKICRRKLFLFLRGGCISNFPAYQSLGKDR